MRMGIFRRIFVATFLIVALGAAPAMAAEMLTLPKAIEMALEKNRNLVATQLDADAAKWSQYQSVSGYLPKVYFNTSVTRIDQDTLDQLEEYDEVQRQFAEIQGRDPDDIDETAIEDTYSSSIRVVQPIFNGGKEIVAIKAATHEKRRQQLAYEDTLASTKNTVSQAFYEAQKAASLEQTAKEALALSKETLRTTNARFEVGQLSRAEVMRWESQVANAEGNLIEATNALRLARLNLNAVIGAELPTEWEFPEVTDTIADEVLDNGEKAADGPMPDPATVTDHPAVMQVGETVNLAKSEEWNAATNVLPSANFVFNYAWENNDTLDLDGDENWTATISVEIPLFQSLGGIFGITSAHKSLLSAELQEDEFRRGFLQRLQNARLNLKAAAQRVKASRKEVAFAEENFEIVKTRESIGAATNLELLDAQFSYIQAKGRLATAIADLQIAGAEWEYVNAN
ncbi:MAG: TolC family protein [Deltaproteobacteria bacterium]|nr:TolC family protein [Deltaproteobacteria bacterium]MCB9488388.1 TolC family protein [Deltaproteobacteria bacterium]